MPLIFASNTVVSSPLALSWICFDLTSLSFYSNETVLVTVINDLSLTKLQGLFCILVCLSIFVFQSNNCSFLFDIFFLLWVRDFVLAWALSRVSIYLFIWGGVIIAALRSLYNHLLYLWLKYFTTSKFFLVLFHIWNSLNFLKLL